MTELEALREENERLKAAIEWVLLSLNADGTLALGLRDRAFTEPETEEVEVKAYLLIDKDTLEIKSTSFEPHNSISEWFVEKEVVVGTRTIPKPRKVKRREECDFTRKSYYPDGTKFFAEWEE